MPAKSEAFYLNRAAQASPEIRAEAGRSGYFSAPESGLDPDLFDGDTLKPEIREHILWTFQDYMAARYTAPGAWSRLWLAGSGISYQWSADRGNGDLDVMAGIDVIAFRQFNAPLAGLSDAELADHINTDLKANLWPATAATRLGSKTYEITYYWNPGCGSDPRGVLAIHPYAAYDLNGDAWTVRPPKLPSDPRTLYPASWWAASRAEAERARTIISRYNSARHAAATTTGPGKANALAQLRLAAAQASELFDDIHLGRRAAFGPGGQGYSDQANFRWQQAKAAGYGPALAEIAAVARSGREAAEVALYGKRIESASAARVKALLWANRGIS
ncbi:hypothetical protein ACWDTT_15990 [Streptosporangium sandarakinum]